MTPEEFPVGDGEGDARGVTVAGYTRRSSLLRFARRNGPVEARLVVLGVVVWVFFEKIVAVAVQKERLFSLEEKTLVWYVMLLE